MKLRAALIAASLFAPLKAFGSEALPSVVSLDYCADQYVLALGDAGQIKGLSRESRMPHSFYRDRAMGLPQTGASIEEILGIAPDVVVTTWGGGPRLFSHLRTQGIEVVRAPYEDSIAQVAANLTHVGAALDRVDRAQELADDLRLRQARLEAKPGLALTAAYLTPGGVTAGRGTTVDTTLRLAGFRTLGEEMALDGWPGFPLEQALRQPPDVFVTGFYDQPSAQEAHWSLARHASVRSLLQNHLRIDVPGRYLSCNGLFIVDAAELIRSQTDEALQREKEEAQ
ncbi:MAG: ABC transporter substrate-binding protein [Alphaproteobacteria bacterium]|nr:MAG: ABC transporter substrate-binding protein [Alphaproteobacteria bacterium]